MNISEMLKIDYKNNEKQVGVVLNPFANNNVEIIYIFIRPKECSYNASIEFRNGNTRGEQKIQAKSFDELLTKISNLFTELE